MGIKRRYAKTITVYQMEVAECGAASLAMILAYFGKNVSLEEMRVAAEVSRNGCNAKNLVKAAREYGLEAHVFSMDAEQTTMLQPPCIIYWMDNHFLVYEGKKGKTIFLNDPSFGRRRLSFQEFQDGHSGVVLTFFPNEFFIKGKGNACKWWNTAEKNHASQAWIIFIAFIIDVLLALLEVGFCKCIGDVATCVFMGRDFLHGFLSSTLLMPSVWILGFCCRNYILQKKLLQNNSDLSSRFLSHLFLLPVSFFEQRYASDISNRIKNVARLCRFINEEGPKCCSLIVRILVYSIALLIIYPPFVFVGIISFAFYMLMGLMIQPYLREIHIRDELADSELYGRFRAGISQLDSLRASGTELAFVRGLYQRYEKNSYLWKQKKKGELIEREIGTAIAAISFAWVLAPAMAAVIGHNMGIDLFYTAIVLYGLGCRAEVSLLHFFQSLSYRVGEMDRIMDIMEHPADKAFERKSCLPIESKLRGRVEVRHLCYGYGKSKRMQVNDVSFSVDCGKCIAITGASGSGKSTVAKLVCGLYSPRSGEILMDGMELADLPSEIVHASVSYVGPNIRLFSGTVRENLTMWNRSILEEDMVRAAKDACIHEVIVQRPGAYDYFVDENGRNFSGGQCQRLEIARALSINPSILILDEATSSLDSLTERMIIDNIKRRGCTCIIIAHRRGAMRDCEEVIIMEEGRVKSRGRYDKCDRNFREGNFNGWGADINYG